MKKNRLSALLIIVVLLFLSAAPASAAETAQTVKLEKTEGTVSIAKNTDKPVSVREGMKLYNGYIITTDAESYAWVSLDDTKLIKLDASSSAEIRKNGNLFEVNVIKGSAFFDVSEKLGNDESLNIRTSTMAVGIRGTSGWVNARDSYNSDIVILEGSSQCAVSDPVTNQVKSAVLNSGEAAVCVVYPADKQGDKCDILLGEIKTQDIPGYVLVELVSNIELCEKILEASGLDILADLAKSAGGDPTGREADGSTATQEVLREAENIKRAAEQEAALRQQEIDAIIEQSENNASQTNVWEGQPQSSPEPSEQPTPTPEPSETPAPVHDTEPSPELSAEPEPSEEPEQKIYTITLNANGGTISPATLTTAEDGSLAAIPEPSRENCEFLGWYTAPSGGILISVPYTFAADTTLYAQWKGWSREGDTVYIFGPGAMDDYTSTGPWGNDITAAVIEDGITNVGNYAFANCTNLESVTLAPSVTSIGERAFSGCASLTGTSARSRAAGLELPSGLKTIGNSAFNGCSSLQSISFPSSLTSIGANAFENSGLTSVTIPSGVENIGYGAFENCKNLTEATLLGGTGSLGISVFADCSALTSVLLPSGIKSIPDYMFARCANLVNVNIPSEVESIGTSAFGNCSSLVSIEVPDGVTSIGRLAFISSGINTINIPDSVTTIGDFAFSFAPLTSVVIPDSVTSLGSGVFDRCPDLTSVKLPANITSIGSAMFYGCSNIADIEIPDKVASIGASAFLNCSNIESLEMPTSLTELATDVFSGCTKLKSITFNGNAPSVNGESLGINLGSDVSGGYVSLYYTDATGFADPWARYPTREINTAAFTVSANGTLTNFNPVLYSSNDVVIPSQVNGIQIKSIGASAFTDCTDITSVIIPHGVTTIDGNNNSESGAFTGCASLKSITIPNSVTNIGSWAFRNCTSLADVNLPDNLSIIEPFTFANCSALSAVTLPSNLSIIGQAAFQSCSSLTSVQIPANVTDIANDAFSACTGLVSINIPNGVTTIESQTFLYCTALETVTLPLSITQIQNDAFKGCEKLTITYAGTIADWASLDKGNIPSSIRVICSDGTYGAESGASLASVMNLETSVHITFNANGGDTPIDSAQTDDDGMLISYPVPTRNGYDFLGWYSEPEGGEQVDENTVFAENTTLYAHWEKQNDQNSLQNDTQISDSAIIPDEQNLAEPENGDTEQGYSESTDQNENIEVADNEMPAENESENQLNDGGESASETEELLVTESSDAENLANSAYEEENILLSISAHNTKMGNAICSFANKILTAWNKELCRI